MKTSLVRLLQTLLIALIIAIVLFLFLRTGKDEVSPENNPRPVRVEKPVRMDLSDEVEAWGNLESPNQVTILPKVSGTITIKYVKTGDSVEEGTVLGEIDREAYRLNLEAADATRSAAASTWERIEKLYASGNASRQNWDDARANHRAAEAQASAAALRYEWTRIEAPVSGVVLMDHVNIGSLVSPEAGTPVFTIGSLDNLEFEVSIPAGKYADFTGDEYPSLRIRASSFPDMEIEGEIELVAPWVDPSTRSFIVTCQITDGGEMLRPGMLVSVLFRTSREEDVLVLPEEALTAGKAVWMVDENRQVALLPLENPRLIGGYLLVPEIWENIIFIVEGQHFLKEGEAVRILETGEVE